MNLQDACDESYEQAQSDNTENEHFSVTNDAGTEIGYIEILETDVVYVEPTDSPDDGDLFDLGVVSRDDYEKLVREVLL
jgi:hypothetical protein